MKYITGYDAMNPNGIIIPKPSQYVGSSKDIGMNPTSKNAIKFSADSIDAILAVSPDIATLNAFLNDIRFNKGIIVNV